MYMDEFRDGESVDPTVINKAPERTVYILHVPGGGLFAANAATSIKILENLTEESISTLVHIKDGVSGGAIIEGGLSIPSPDDPIQQKISGAQSQQFFFEQIPLFFPEINRRLARMFATQAIHTISDILDPLEREKLQIDGINKACSRIEAKLDPLSRDEISSQLKTIHLVTSKRWFSAKERDAVIKACTDIANTNEGYAPDAEKISRLIQARACGSSLRNMFARSVHNGLNKLKDYKFAKDYLYPAEVAQDFYRQTFGETRLSECLGSLYITMYNETKGEPVTYFSRREDLFDMSPDAKRVTSPADPKIWDLVMGSTANPFAYRNHRMEDGTICSDIATIHTPLKAVCDAVAFKPKDAKVKLIILGTGRVIDHDRHKHDIIDYNSKHGVLGNLIKNTQLDMLHYSSMGMFRNSVESLIGTNNILEITPCLSAEDYEDSLQLPSHDMTDGRPANIEKFKRFCEKFEEKEISQFKSLAFELIQNCYHLGRMSEEKYSRVARKLGYEPVLIPKEPEKIEIPEDSNVIQLTFPEPAIVETTPPDEKQKPAAVSRLSWIWAYLGWKAPGQNNTPASNDTARLDSKQRQLAP